MIDTLTPLHSQVINAAIAVITAWEASPYFSETGKMAHAFVDLRATIDAQASSWAVEPVQPTPLTDEQVAAISIDVGFTGFNHRFAQFVRAIESAHCISAPVTPTLSPNQKAES